ncbi:MAG TPA: hypothetical protein VN833_28280, partial [Candidatus Acidoferrales bacterium]|nr:hypothetical protein [Candidatus Acidoferrales bacterium]
MTDPAYSAPPGYFDKGLRPALETPLEQAVAAGVVRPGIEADDLLRASRPYATDHTGAEPVDARRMVELLVDGLRYGAGTQIVNRGSRLDRSADTSRLCGT